MRKSLAIKFYLVLAISIPGCKPGPDKSDEPKANNPSVDVVHTPSPTRDGAAQCQRDEDCVASTPVTTPAGCAVPTCNTTRGVCEFRTKDDDNDSFRAANCRAEDGTEIGVGLDCNDGDPSVNPTSAESCNGADDDCDQRVDEDIPPNPDLSCQVGLGVCQREGHQVCVDGEWGGCSAQPGQPQGPDAPRCDGIDYACDGPATLDCECVSGDRAPCPDCPEPGRECTHGKWSACPESPRQLYCEDLDGDRFATQTEQICPFPARTGWLPAERCLGSEPVACGADARLNPGAAPVCGADMDCDQQPDIPAGGNCAGPNTVGECQFAPGCGETRLPGLRSCDGNCTWTECLPIAMWSPRVWQGDDLKLSHDCGNVQESDWHMPRDCAFGQTVTFGPYLQDVPMGRYKVGFKVRADGFTTFNFQVTRYSGNEAIPIIEKVVNLPAPNDCVEFHNVDLNPCSGIEFRALYRPTPIPTPYSFFSGRANVDFDFIKLSLEDGQNACE